MEFAPNHRALYEEKDGSIHLLKLPISSQKMPYLLSNILVWEIDISKSQQI